MADNASWTKITGVAGLREFYAGRRVLVAGADGFLGGHCVAALRELDAEVSIVSRRATPRLSDFDGAVFRGDLRDPDVVRDAATGQSVVFDFAGSTGPVDSNEHPLQNVAAEVAPHLSLFVACAEAPRPPLVVYCSSRVVYGRPQYLPVNETHRLQPDSLYAVHKIAAENYLAVFRRTHGLPSCIVRLSNPYGPESAPHLKSYGAINHFIELARTKRPISIFGDGGQIRDYIHIEDALAAFLSVAAEEKCHGDVFNLGGRFPLRLRDAVEEIAAAAGGTAIEFVPWPEHTRWVETGDYFSDLAKLDEFVALPPQYTFAEGVRRVMECSRGRVAAAGPCADAGAGRGPAGDAAAEANAGEA